MMNVEDADGSRSGHGRRGYLQEGAWEAIHVIQVDLICKRKKKDGRIMLHGYRYGKLVPYYTTWRYKECLDIRQ